MSASKQFRKSSGISIVHTINLNWPVAVGIIQTPPMPFRQVSTYPWIRGRFGTSCAIRIGLFATSAKSHLKSSKIAFKSSVIRTKLFFCCAIACQIPVKSPRPPGIPIDAWCRTPASFWKSLRGTHFFFLIRLSAAFTLSTFFGGSAIVCFFPSMIQPKISFTWSHCPSSCCSFFSEIGSPPL